MEKEPVIIGNFVIYHPEDDRRIWIHRFENGEGAEFDLKALEEIIRKFYEENF